MSLTPLPPPPREVRLWLIFFALPAMNGPLPAELKFRENTANLIMVIFVLYATQTQFKQDQSDTSFIDLCNPFTWNCGDLLTKTCTLWRSKICLDLCKRGLESNNAL